VQLSAHLPLKIMNLESTWKQADGVREKLQVDKFSPIKVLANLPCAIVSVSSAYLVSKCADSALQRHIEIAQSYIIIYFKSFLFYLFLDLLSQRCL
jgi:hypothetical protein